MRSAHLAALVACVATALLASSTYAGETRALVVRSAAGAPAETTWIATDGAGVRVLSDAAGVRVLPGGTDRRSVPSATATAGRYIVRLQESAQPGAAAFAAGVQARHALTDRFLTELARREPARFGARGTAGIRVVREYDRLIAGVALEAPASALAMLRATPGVARVDEDLPVHTLLDRSVPQVGGDRVRDQLQGTGRGVRVGIVDTGIDYRHAAFGGAFGPGTRVAGGEDFVNHDNDPLDDNGHGTHVAGIVAGHGGGVVGMAIEATLYAYKVLNEYGGGLTSDVIAGLERCADPDHDPATDDRLDVVNLSLGAFGGDPDDAFSQAVDALDALGTTVVVAAGNAGFMFSIADPAIARGAIAVGATMRADTTAPFSSRGPGPDLAPKPDLMAPGDEIVSAAMGGGSVAMSGTSMAAPHVAGAAALLRQLHPEWTHDEVRAALVGAAHDLGRAVFEQGAGRLDAWAAATATLFATPTRLAFGRVRPGGPDTVLTRTLTLRSRAATSTPVTLRVTAERAVPGVTIVVAPAALTLPPGGEASVTVSVTFHASRPTNRAPPFVAEGLVVIQSDAEVRHVPYSVHDCLELRATLDGSGAFGVVHDRDRVWPSMGFLQGVWLLPPGDYGVMAFGSGIDMPARIAPDVHVATDRDLELNGTPADRVLRWAITDEAGSPLVRSKMDIAIRHTTSGASLGFIGYLMVPESVLPEAGPDYRLEWAAYEDQGAVRHDIAGVVDGPFASATVTNDRSRLRRYTEHFAVTPGDSVLPLEFRLHPDGAGGEFGFSLIDPHAPKIASAYDVVQWRSPTPYPGHWRLGRLDWQIHPEPLLGAPGDFVVATGPPLSLDRGDTVGVHRLRLSEPPALAITGNRLSFGGGPSVFTARIAAEASSFAFAPGPGQSARLFSDMIGSKFSGPAARWEVMVDSRIVAADTVEGEGSVESFGFYQRPLALPPGSRGTLIVHAAEASVLGAPSRTTVRVDFGNGAQTATPTLESFAVMAGGSVVEEVRFGQERAPHVEFTASPPPGNAPLIAEVFYRVGDAATWSPLAVSEASGRFTAPLVPADGPVSLRLRIGTLTWGTLEMDVEPAFIAHRSPVVEAPVLQTLADVGSVRVDWHVPAIDGPLVVERSEPDGPWLDWGEVTPVNGIARYEDTGVVPGKRYGYRLAGGHGVAWVQVPVGPPQLALAIAPNPARGELVLALRVDRSAPITLSLLDLQGRVMTSRRLESPLPGAQFVRLVTSGRVAPGLYFVRLEREHDVITRRVTLLE